jgi:spore coat protein U-like protein
VNFGSYDMFSNSALDTTGNIDVNCPSGVGYSMALTAGGGTHTQRVMNSGGHRLNYNLYTAANRAVVWGDATSGTVRVNGTGIGVNVNHGVYGRIPALQNVRTGSYSDIIIVELTFWQYIREKVRAGSGQIYATRDAARSDMFDYIEMFYNNKLRRSRN